MTHTYDEIIRHRDRWHLRPDDLVHSKTFDMLTDYANRIKADESAVTDAVLDAAQEAAMAIKHNKEPWFPMTRHRLRAALLAVWPSPPAQAAQMSNNMIFHHANWIADMTLDLTVVLSPNECTRIHRFACEIRDALSSTPTAESVEQGDFPFRDKEGWDHHPYEAECIKPHSPDAADSGRVACPITKRPFFMSIEHPSLGIVDTYGGPFDSYTIPEPDEDGCFRSERYDHDAGEWTEGGNPEPLMLVHDDEYNDLYNRANNKAALAAQGQGEAVAWQTLGENGQWFNLSVAEYWTLKNNGVGQQRTLYTTPPAPPAGVPDGWVDINESQPERNKAAIYWNTSNHVGFPDIADEWRDEHHRNLASHWLPFAAPTPAKVKP